MNNGLPVDNWLGNQRWVSLSPHYHHTGFALVGVQGGFPEDASGIYATSNGATSWQIHAATSLPYQPIVFSPNFENDSTILVGGFNVLYLSEDVLQILTIVWNGDPQTWGIRKTGAFSEGMQDVVEEGRSYLPLVINNSESSLEFWLVASGEGYQKQCFLRKSIDNGVSWIGIDIP